MSTKRPTVRQVARKQVTDNHSSSSNRRPFAVILGCVIVAVVFVVICVAFAMGNDEQAQSSADSAEVADVTEITDATDTTDATDVAGITDATDAVVGSSDDEESGKPVSITITAAGDCTLGTDENFDYSRSFNAAYESVQDPAWFFSNVAGVFADDDLTIVNMEGTLTTSTARADKTYAFKGDAEYAQVLVDGNVEAASLANNHSEDYGEQSYNDTIDALEGANIKAFGDDRIAYFDIKGVKVALIGTYELDLGLDIQDEMVNNIHAAQDAGAEIIVVYAHWGVEYEYVPDDTQIELAHAAIDAGASVVIGSHPHVMQGYEKYHGRYIIYSLGNFCFGGNSNPSDKDCLIFQQTFTVDNGQVATDDNINVMACSVSSTSDRNDYRPTLAQDSEKERIEAKLEESNEAIAERSAALSQAE